MVCSSIWEAGSFQHIFHPPYRHLLGFLPQSPHDDLPLSIPRHLILPGLSAGRAPDREKDQCQMPFRGRGIRDDTTTYTTTLTQLRPASLPWTLLCPRPRARRFSNTAATRRRRCLLLSQGSMWLVSMGTFLPTGLHLLLKTLPPLGSCDKAHTTWPVSSGLHRLPFGAQFEGSRASSTQACLPAFRFTSWGRA